MGACLKNRCKRRVLAAITACVMAGSVLLSGCKETKRTYSSETESDKENGTYHVDTMLWSADIPKHFKRGTPFMDRDDENNCAFCGDLNDPFSDYIEVDIRTEHVDTFVYCTQKHFSIRDYYEGKLPLTNIDGYEFAEFTETYTANWAEVQQKTYIYRYAPAHMTVRISFCEKTPSGSYEGYALLDHIDLKLPDLGLSDPPFDCEKGEFSEMPMKGFRMSSEDCIFRRPPELVVSSKDDTLERAASGKYLYEYSDVNRLVYVYKIDKNEVTQMTTVQIKDNSVDTVNLPDGDSLTVYNKDYFLLVESSGDKETILSLDPSTVVSPDGQTIIYRQSSKLHYDSQKKEVTSEPFELNTPGQIYSNLEIFVTNTNIYVRGEKRLTDQTDINYPLEYHVFEYDLDGKLIREFNNTQRNLKMEAVYDIGSELIIVNGDYSKESIEQWDKEGNYLAGYSLESQYGHLKERGMSFLDYSLVSYGDRGGGGWDYILLVTYSNISTEENDVEHYADLIHVGY